MAPRFSTLYGMKHHAETLRCGRTNASLPIFIDNPVIVQTNEAHLLIYFEQIHVATVLAVTARTVLLLARLVF